VAGHLIELTENREIAAYAWVTLTTTTAADLILSQSLYLET
jgi:hypothetical protein